ncbi:MAG: TetR/AcrR family transcriptional regulator, partial [Candidatus Aminicenantes bacterium]|nr:TetR/AcrR family transcriptional regulator [Candidatus Aminicenantes bacterium]
MAKSKRDGPESRRRILAAAEHVFAAKGFDGARVDEIARQAGVNKALIYHYFKSKKEILRILLADFIARMLERTKTSAENLEHLLSAESAHDDLRAALEFLEGHANILRIMMMESVKKTERAPLVFKTLDASVAMYQGARAKDILKELRRKGIRIEDDIRRVLVNEFFTKSLPVIFFVLFHEAWCEHFGVREKDLKEWFIRAVEAT